MITRVAVVTMTAVALLASGCAQRTVVPSAPNATSRPNESDMLGVYTSPEEISVFTGTVLVLERDTGSRLSYRMRFYTDFGGDTNFGRPERNGDFVIDGDKLYVPRASGFFDEDGKPELISHIERYTLRSINGRRCLLRDDALEAFERHNKLYDYGVLIRVADMPGIVYDLGEAEHISIKALYDDPTRGWKDPFVNGPNPR